MKARLMVAFMSRDGTDVIAVLSALQVKEIVKIGQEKSMPSGIGTGKIPAIKHLRTLTGLDLRDSKDIVDALCDPARRVEMFAPIEAVNQSPQEVEL